ncbi:MAG: mandelate racemase/muconate lactonizing enzyme family protein [Acidimicrobiia bacterium]|nr:mandelate racemase/muconate lactonizing enzyme family protein [Acidimicrobiia bacterium]
MRITAIDTFHLRTPLVGAQFWSSQAYFHARKALLIRIQTDAGLTGWGEGGQYGPAEPVASAVHHVLAPVLLGADPRSPEVLWDKMYSLTRDFGRKGPILEAISGVDVALWDILGKSCNAPAYTLMGGAFRRRVRTYATGLYYRGEGPITLEQDLPKLREEAASYAAAGFPAVKMKVGLLRPEEDLVRIAATREVLGTGRLLMVDANHAYAAHVACRLARAMEEHDIYWFEEPVEPEDLAGYQQVKASTRIAIAGGECEYSRFGFLKWFTSRALDIVQPDLACVGGLSEARRIAALASAFHIQCMPHVWGSGVGLAAGLQFLSTLAPSPSTAAPVAPFNEPLLEWDANPNPLRTDLLTHPVLPEQGYVPVPDGPGLGIEVNLDVLGRYLVNQTTTAA